MSRQPLHQLVESFSERHLGPRPGEQAKMLAEVGVGSIDELLDQVVPESIRLREPLRLPAGRSEAEATAELARRLAPSDRPATALIGLGYTGTITPPVIRRSILENPAWYTAYTPYQPEISQGRLEALLNFQTMVADLTGMELAGASLLDEPTAVAEAVALARRVGTHRGEAVLLDAGCHPQTIAVVATRAEPVGLAIEVGDPEDYDPARHLAVVIQDPSSTGALADRRALTERVHAAGGLVIVATDLLACCLVEPPGAWGADVVVGSAQRFGVPMWFGGPHAGFLATRSAFARSLPGRLVGVSTDPSGRPALRLALQTREQHIRREKATSNICTAQVLLAVVASTYAVWHGPDGLARLAGRVHRLATVFAHGARAGGFEVVHPAFFDTVAVRVPGRAAELVASAAAAGYLIRQVDPDTVSVTFDETSSVETVDAVWKAIGCREASVASIDAVVDDAVPEDRRRTEPFLTHPVFHQHRSEHDLMRYLRRLADRDLALDRTSIPLGSCTMKLNAASEMEPISWPSVANLHPFAPLERSAGLRSVIADLERWLGEVTGYDAVSLQPNAGSQGELAGLLAIRGWHRSRGEGERDVCLIPSSAHGTNAASAVMAGMRVVVVACDERGDVDLDDLRAKVAEHGDRLAALMVTYPSTHGVFEDGIGELCAIVHGAGGQVYVDGANLNALVGVAKPGWFGADVSHLNLHKTFCIPHGGGGPGVGPVACRAHLAPFLPNHPLVAEAGPATGPGPVSGAPWGSAGILPIPWMYVAMMGADGLREATGVAILAANYVATRLAPHFPVLYTGRGGRVAHECILDLRPLTKATGVSVDDVAKRLMDHGIHAPTVSFPVAGTLMVEPTESESLAEIDRFVEAMIAIRAEIADVAEGRLAIADSPLRHAPHTAADVTATDWDRAYPREVGAYPSGRTLDKYWPAVGRIDGAAGDRNLQCACPPLEAYAV